jgi:hypothetical protein
MSSHKKVNFDTDNFSAGFKALLRVHSELLDATVTASNRSKFAVKIFSDMVYWYIPRSPPTPTHKTCLLSAVGDLK